MQAVTPVPQEDLIAGRYALEARIGEGTFSVTYRARDITLGRTVALKMLRRQFAVDPTFVSRFEREARVAASVAHPNVVDVFDYGADRGTFFIAMRFVQGQDLKWVLAEGGPLPPSEAVRITDQILRGLGAIHDAGIIHRDIKPQNVLLGDDGAVRVADFGIAYGRVGDALTSHGTTVGTASYMAPEQARGGALSEATDLYAVGVVLFELLTGRLPFEAENPMAVMLAHLQRPAPSLATVAPESGIPSGLDAVVQRALAKDAAARYATAAVFAQAMHAAVAGLTQGRHAARTATRPVIRASVVPPPTSASAARPDAATQASPRAPVAIAAVPRQLMPPAVPARRRRREFAWTGPIVFVGLALAILGAILARELLTGDANGGGDGSDAPGAAPPGTPGLSLVAPAVTEEPSVTPTQQPLAVSTRTPPAPTRTPEPNPTTAPTATATPEPTKTPEPPTQTPPPTETPVPTETPAAPPSAEPGPPTIAPAGGSSDDTPALTATTGAANQGSGSEAALRGAGTNASATFTAEDWQGGYYRGDGEFYGRSWVALYGALSEHPSAKIVFSIEGTPEGDAVLNVTGLDDEWSDLVAIAVHINGEQIYSGPSPFASWDGVGNGENAAWTSSEITIPAGLLLEGTNEIEILNLEQTANYGSPPYLLLSDATLEVGGAVTITPVAGQAVILAAGEADDTDRGNGNSGRGNGENKKDDNSGRGGGDDDDDDD